LCPIKLFSCFHSRGDYSPSPPPPAVSQHNKYENVGIIQLSLAPSYKPSYQFLEWQPHEKKREHGERNEETIADKKPEREMENAVDARREKALTTVALEGERDDNAFVCSRNCLTRILCSAVVDIHLKFNGWAVSLCASFSAWQEREEAKKKAMSFEWSRRRRARNMFHLIKLIYFCIDSRTRKAHMHIKQQTRLIS
jgi:hypothetical protein